MAKYIVKVHTTEMIVRTYEVEADTANEAYEEYWDCDPCNEEGDHTEVDLIEVFDEEGNEVEIDD